MLEFIRDHEDAALVQEIDSIAAQLQDASEQSDRTGEFVKKQIQALQSSKYLAKAVPRQYGGSEIGLYQLCLMQERLAQVDASAALVAGWHNGIVLSLRETHAWNDDVFATFCKRAVQGQTLLNACATETDAGSPSRGGRPSTTAQIVDGGFLLTGKKSFATGSPMLTHILVTAYVTEWGETAEFLVTSETTGITIEHTWDSMSMRASGSHTLVLERVFVPEVHMMDRFTKGKRSKRSGDGGGWLLHIPATYLGIATRASEYAIAFAKSHQPASLGQPIATLVQVRERIGKMEALRATARNLLYSVAARYDAVEQISAQRMTMRSDFAMVKYVATNAAVEIVDLAMRIVGGTSILEHTPLERCYRDVRAGLHNPPMDDVSLAAIAQAALDNAEETNDKIHSCTVKN